MLQASKAMFSVLNKGNVLNLPIDILLELFDQMVVPVLVYGCEIWGHEDCKSLENVHLKFCKYILGVKKATPSSMVYGELGRFPIDIVIKCRMVLYWVNILNSDERKLNRKMYNVLFRLYQDNMYKSPWLSYIHRTLDECGLGFVWQQQADIYLFNREWIKLTLKRVLQDMFIQEWNVQVTNSPKCSEYATYKMELTLEPYLIKNSKEIYRYIVKLRTSNHNLPIEKGRYCNIDRKDRICTLCEGNKLGDEYHYIMECSFFTELRKKFVPKYYRERPNMLKFIQLMQRVNESKCCYRLSRLFKSIVTHLK